MFETYTDIVNVKGMCLMLGIGRNKAYELIRNGEIRALTVGRLIKIPKKEIIRYVENQLNEE